MHNIKQACVDTVTRSTAICDAVAQFAKECGDSTFSTHARTNAFCLQQLSYFSNADLLQQKILLELGQNTWQPLGKILLIISERDILGSVFGFLAAYLTGNSIKIKARKTLPLLTRLKELLGLDDRECAILDWQSTDQNDAHLLHGVDAVLLAGSDAMITHYRKVTPFPVRLVEFGPKLSLAAVTGQSSAEAKAVADLLFEETELFLQDVCSSPRAILVEDMNFAKMLCTCLHNMLPRMPKLDNNTGLQQLLRYTELALLSKQRKADGTPLVDMVEHDKGNSWGISLGRGFQPDQWFNKGFNIAIGNFAALFEAARICFPGRLQTLGVMGNVPPVSVFHRVCTLGTMHRRPLLSPHDGFFELASLVSFTSHEVDNAKS